VTVLPLSAGREYRVERPSIPVIWSFLNRAWTPYMLPVRRWQARQRHMEIRKGSPSHVISSCPQPHDARRVIGISRL
jgi:hypothetical protein